MAAVPSTSALGRWAELGELPRQRDALGSDSMRLVLAKSVTGATDTALRNAVTYADLVTAGWIECDFSGYTAGGKALGPADRTVTYGTGAGPNYTTPFKTILTIAAQTWNPAGGVTNNTPVKAALLYRPDPTTAITACRVLGTCDTSGNAASGGTFTCTFSIMTSQAT